MQEKPNEQKKLLAVGVIVAVIAVMIIIAVIVMGLISGGGTQKTDTKQSDAASTLFYDALGNAAKQQQLRIAMYRATYATKADADSNQNIGTQNSSVAEVDTKAGKMRSAYATNAVNTPQYTLGRCMDGVTYNDDYGLRHIERPTTLDAAAKVLQTNERLFKVTQALTFIPCPGLGILPGAVPDLASFRFSDGVMPVTLTDAQADNWKKKVAAANLFTFKDEGNVAREGKDLKKISFEPKDQTTANKDLYDIFEETAEIAKIKAEHPEAAYQYEFIAVNPSNTGSVGGYYLIDESTKLPVYSELYGTNKERGAGESSSVSQFNIARTKQTYAFGAPLSLTYETPLEITK